MFAKEKCFNMAVTKDKPDKENLIKYYTWSVRKQNENKTTKTHTLEKKKFLKELSQFFFSIIWEWFGEKELMLTLRNVSSCSLQTVEVFIKKKIIHFHKLKKRK